MMQSIGLLVEERSQLGWRKSLLSEKGKGQSLGMAKKGRWEETNDGSGQRRGAELWERVVCK